MSALSTFRPLYRRTRAEGGEIPSYRTAWAEAWLALERLGLLFGRHPQDGEAPIGDLVVAAYRGGWQACETRLDSPEMSDAISTALATPELVLERLANESMHRWQVRAVRQVVAYGLAKR